MACASTAPRPRAEDQAAEVERARCSADVEEKTLLPIFAADSVESVQPLYARVPTGGAGVGGNYPQLIGASIKLRPTAGFTTPWLDRALECHSARSVLGRMHPTAADDPFWLPGRMVDIEVLSAGAGLQVFVRGQNIKDAKEILARANAFAEARARR